MKTKAFEFPVDLKERAYNSIRWLYGGNYTNEFVEDFNKVLSLFAKQAFLEQENLIDVLLFFFSEDDFICLDEEETLSKIDEIYQESLKE